MERWTKGGTNEVFGEISSTATLEKEEGMVGSREREMLEEVFVIEVEEVELVVEGEEEGKRGMLLLSSRRYLLARSCSLLRIHAIAMGGHNNSDVGEQQQQAAKKPAGSSLNAAELIAQSANATPAPSTARANLSSIVPGWFSEISAMWPGEFTGEFSLRSWYASDGVGS